ncbi:MAG: hypothetical protein J2O48_03075, partial [Solirubrobacterales bacterium]|nr:hypothetical protein [Solirubrobacterales bacterium]
MRPAPPNLQRFRSTSKRSLGLFGAFGLLIVVLAAWAIPAVASSGHPSGTNASAGTAGVQRDAR